jgi:hypothetical protein
MFSPTLQRRPIFLGHFQHGFFPDLLIKFLAIIFEHSFLPAQYASVITRSCDSSLYKSSLFSANRLCFHVKTKFQKRIRLRFQVIPHLWSSEQFVHCLGRTNIMLPEELEQFDCYRRLAFQQRPPQRSQFIRTIWSPGCSMRNQYRHSRTSVLPRNERLVDRYDHS